MHKRLLFLFFLFNAAYGDTLGKPGCVAVGADWLYMTAAIDQPYYVITSNSEDLAHGKRYGSNQHRHRGYRVEALYRFCNRLSETRVRFTHIPRFSDKNAVISKTSIQPVFATPKEANTAPGSATLHEDFNVFALDFLFGQTLFNFCNFRFLFQAGLQYGYASFVEKVIFNTTQVGGVNPRIVFSRSKVVGAGPEIGFDFSYKIWRWFTFTGRGSSAFLISNRKASFNDNGTQKSTGRESTTATNSANWIVVPTTDLRLGLAFRTPCDFRRWFDCSPIAALGCLDIDFEIGYEVIAFYKAVDRIFFSDDTVPGNSVDEIMDLTFHGPYIHLGLSF
jgi:hypothetical protein